MNYERTSIKLTKEVLLDLLEVLNEYDIRLDQGNGRALLAKDILRYHNLLGQLIRPLVS